MEDWTGVIAIDGPAGAGKSTVAKKVASELGIRYLDTGALYRALAFFLDRLSIPAEESEVLSKALSHVAVDICDSKVLLNDEDVSSFIRTPKVDKIASLYSALPTVREKLLSLQRRLRLLKRPRKQHSLPLQRQATAMLMNSGEKKEQVMLMLAEKSKIMTATLITA